ncbi:hypothetical protein BC835DRAFT_1472948 [Cytidiella melzeri]|nr:hypothetical protein BC835DRAFT_1472948 [Cytidiella melzeri]
MYRGATSTGQLGCIAQVTAVVTVYNTAGVVQQPLGTATGSAAVASSSALSAWLAAMPAFNNEVLQPPPVLSPAPPTQFTLGLQTSAAAVSGLSIPLNGSFLGFSIEMSVVTQVIGINLMYLSVPFLNLMALVAQRGGTVPIRVGGNTQEYATLVPSIPDGKAIEKDKDDTSNPTATPTLIFTDEIIYMLNNVSALVDVKWYLGTRLYGPLYNMENTDVLTLMSRMHHNPHDREYTYTYTRYMYISITGVYVDIEWIQHGNSNYSRLYPRNIHSEKCMDIAWKFSISTQYPSLIFTSNVQCCEVGDFEAAQQTSQKREKR